MNKNELFKEILPDTISKLFNLARAVNKGRVHLSTKGQNFSNQSPADGVDDLSSSKVDLI